MAENHVYFCFLEDLSEEEKNLPLHKISVIDEGEQRPVSMRHTLHSSKIYKLPWMFDMHLSPGGLWGYGVNSF